MHPFRLPDDTLLVPVDLSDSADGFALVEVGLDHPDYGTWLALVERGEDPTPAP